jgi:hypothetical protein
VQEEKDKPNPANTPIELWNDLRGDVLIKGYIVEYSTNPTGVPEPESLTFLGVGVGIAVLRLTIKQKR